MAGGRDWTTTEVRRLYELRGRRIKTVDIGRILGRTEGAINNFIRYVPVSPGHPPSRRRVPRINLWTAEEIAALRDLADRGASVARVAATLRRTRSAVENKAKLERVQFHGGRR